MEYIEIDREKTFTGMEKQGSKTMVHLTNGDRIHVGSVGTIYAGQWFFYHKLTKYTRRLPKSNSYEEAREEYQEATGNCII